MPLLSPSQTSQSGSTGSYTRHGVLFSYLSSRFSVSLSLLRFVPFPPFVIITNDGFQPGFLIVLVQVKNTPDMPPKELVEQLKSAIADYEELVKEAGTTGCVVCKSSCCSCP